MPKKSLTFRDFTKGLNTESSPRDIDDSALARSVGASIERPGIVRPLGKANSQSGDGLYYSFRDKDDNIIATDAVQDPGHGLFAFSYSYNHGEKSAITKVVSDYTTNSGVTSVYIADDIGTGKNECNFADGDIVRIYGKTANKELNHRYFVVRYVSANNKRIELRVISDGDEKEFSLTDEGGRRVASAIIDTGAHDNGSINTTQTTLNCTSPDPYTAGRDMFAAGDYIQIGTEAMKVVSVDATTATDTLTVERGALGTTATTHLAAADMYIYTHGPDHSGTGGSELITAGANNKAFGGSNNWAILGASASVTTDGTAEELVVLTSNNPSSHDGAKLSASYIEDWTAGRKYRITADLEYKTGNADAKYFMGIGNSRMHVKASDGDLFLPGKRGKITGTKKQYYVDVYARDNSTVLSIGMDKIYNTGGATTFHIDNVSVKEIDSLGEDIEDGYIEIVPQRNFTKYIACQNAETINLFVDDTTHSRFGANGWKNRIVDLKDDFKGGTSASDLGLDTLGTDSPTWPSKGIMPTYMFADNALRVSPSNKIGNDDTNYSPRWYGHIKRDKLFGVDDSCTHTNEWYYDTIGIKRPAKMGSSFTLSEEQRFFLGVTNDYSKNNILGLPWGMNWYSHFYLNSKDDMQTSGVAVIQDCDFWENEKDIAEGMSKFREIDNDDSEGQLTGRYTEWNAHEISAGHLIRHHNFIGEQKVGRIDRFRIRRNHYRRELYNIATFKSGNENDLEENREFELGGDYEWVHTDIDKSRWVVGVHYMFHDPNASSPIVIGECLAAENLVDFWDPGDGLDTLLGNGNRSSVSFKFPVEGYKVPGEVITFKPNETKIARVLKSWLTKPSASTDLITNNAGGGFMGAYTLGDAYDGAYLEGKQDDLYGTRPWIGVDAIGRLGKKNTGKMIVEYNYDTTQTPAMPGISISQVVVNGTVATITTAVAHGFSDGDRVAVYSNDGAFDYHPEYDVDKSGISVSNTTTFAMNKNHWGDVTNGTYTDKLAVAVEYKLGLPVKLSTKDETLDNTNWISFLSPHAQSDHSIQSRTVGYSIVQQGYEYYVTYTCRNFWSENGGKLRITVGQTVKELMARGETDYTDEYHDIESNAYKTTVKIKAPSEILEENLNLGVNIQPVTADGKIHDNSSEPEYNRGLMGTSTDYNAYNTLRTLIGDLALTSADRRWIGSSARYNLAQYIWGPSSIAFGFQSYWGLEGDSWGNQDGIDVKYEFYCSFLYDGGATPQESAPRFLRSKKLSDTSGLRLSVSLCYSSNGDVYDMFNKRVIGARLYYKKSDNLESEKLYSLLDVDFKKGVRKSTNANWVPFEADYQNQVEVAMDISDDSDQSEFGNFELLSSPGTRPYKQVKPANVGSHVNGYFRFDSPPTVLDYEILNASQPFEEGEFFAQYKTIATLKGKAYIGNFTILPNGLASSSSNQIFDHYPNAIIASEEGCYDKFPFESKWVNVPVESDDSPIVKLESFRDHLIIHKELSTLILDFKNENDPTLKASLTANGITWHCQSLVSSTGVYWANRFGCFQFDGEKVVDLTEGKISKNSLGWPNNNTDMYYWNIEADNNTLPSLAYDEVNNQLLVVRNSKEQDEGDGDEVWIYDLASESWSSDTADSGEGVGNRFLAAIEHQHGYRTNFIKESGHSIIHIDNRNPDGSEYNLTKWENKLYTEKDVYGTVIEGDLRPLEFLTKEIDFGNPHTKKRIFQVYVTYRLNTLNLDGSPDGGGTDGIIDVNMNYGLDGGAPTTDFDKVASDSYSSSFDDTAGAWKIASLVTDEPTDCFAFQLKITTGTNKVPYNFEVNDITFVYREKTIKRRVRD